MGCSITESLFYRAYNAYLLQQPEFRENFEMLRDAFKDDPQSFVALGRNNLLRIKQMQEDIRNDRYTLLTGSGLDFSGAAGTASENRGTRHRDICLSIIRLGLLDRYIDGNVDLINMEHPVQYGSIDLLYLARGCAYIVEVKSGVADHAIVGQLGKYYVGMALKLNLKFFDDIKMIAVCTGYDEASLMGLKRMGVQPLLFRSKPPKVVEC